MLKIKQFFTIQSTKKNINLLVFFLLTSFVLGNIFGLNSQNLLIKYREFLFFVFPLFIEVVNFLIDFLKQKISNKNLYSTFIAIRRGFLLGIFMEAFKLGS